MAPASTNNPDQTTPCARNARKADEGRHVPFHQHTSSLRPAARSMTNQCWNDQLRRLRFGSRISSFLPHASLVLRHFPLSSNNAPPLCQRTAHRSADRKILSNTSMSLPIAAWYSSRAPPCQNSEPTLWLGPTAARPCQWACNLRAEAASPAILSHPPHDVCPFPKQSGRVRPNNADARTTSHAACS